MKISFLFFTLFAGTVLQTQSLNKHFFISTQKQQQETVYICDSKSATKYHAEEDCRGLNNCKAEILSIDKKEAIKKGREECGWCY